MIKIFLLIYLNITIMTLLHEYGHFITACILNYKVTNVTLGDRLFGIRIKKLSISPFILSGEINVEIENSNTSPFNLFIYYFAGIYYQIIFQVFIMLFYSNLTILITVSLINLFGILKSSLPFLKSDLNEFRKLYKTYKMK